MIDGLKLTIEGVSLRELIHRGIEEHERAAERWTKLGSDELEEDDESSAVQLPQHMCENEAQRHRWRSEVLRFIHDHLDPNETYRLGQKDLTFAALLPSKPGWLEQQEYEERTAVGFHMGRLVKSVDRLLPARPISLDSGEIDDPDFKITRIDTDGGPEIIHFERK